MTDVKVEMSRSDFRHILTCGTVAQAMEWFDQVQAVLAAKDARIKELEKSVKWETLCHLQQQLEAKDQQVQAWQMAYEGVQRQLTEKDQELARVTALKGHWEELANQYMDRIQAGERQLTEVLKDAKWLAEWVIAEIQTERWKDHYTDEMLEKVCMMNSGYKRAHAFLARPDVQALEKGTPPCE